VPEAASVWSYISGNVHYTRQNWLAYQFLSGLKQLLVVVVEGSAINNHGSQFALHFLIVYFEV